MTTPAGIRAIAAAFPTTVRTNDYWRARQPEVIAALERKTATQVWETTAKDGDIWGEEMAPYLSDVFRGSVERRVLADDERALDMEVRAARRALAAARMTPDDVDKVLVTSLFPDQVVVGNGVHLAAAMGMSCPCWNLESACGAAVGDLLLAASMVESGRARNVLVVVSCAYSRTFEESSPMSWTSADGAAALVIGRAAQPEMLGSHVVSTPETIPAFTNGIRMNALIGPTPAFTATRSAAELLAESTTRHLPRYVDAALAASGMTRADIDFAVFPTPTAWWAAFGRRTLGLAASQTLDTYPRFTNIGPALGPVNLYFAARQQRIRRGDRVLFVSQGSVSTAGAMMLRWGDVAVADECEA